MDNLFTLSTALETAVGTDRLTELGCFNKLRKYWNLVVGEPLAARTSPSKLIRKTLFILVEDSAYADQLSYFKERLLDLIASPAILGGNKVLQIRFRTGDREKPEKEAGGGHGYKRRLNPLKKGEIEKVIQVSDKIRDEELRAAFSGYMTNMKRRQNL